MSAITEEFGPWVSRERESWFAA